MRFIRRSVDKLAKTDQQTQQVSRVHDLLNQRYGHRVTPDLRAELGPVPWTPLGKPLEQATVALFTTAGVHLRSQPGFTVEPDPTFRSIPAETPDSDLVITHAHFNHEDADRDPGIVFPLDLLRHISGRLIGRPAATHYGMMGYLGVQSQWRLLHQAVRELARSLGDSGIDVAVLTPG